MAIDSPAVSGKRPEGSERRSASGRGAPKRGGGADRRAAAAPSASTSRRIGINVGVEQEWRVTAIDSPAVSGKRPEGSERRSASGLKGA